MNALQHNVALVGFMGTGKTSVGQALAARLGLTFLDMDSLIVKRDGRPIAQIFAESGEPYFRVLEHALAQELAVRQGLAIGTGGGIVLNPHNIRALAGTGLVVCLRATPETILARVGNDTARPLLAVPDKLKAIRELLDRRQALYDAIPHQVDTTGLTVEDVASRIEPLYRAWKPRS